jgi:hypothetical protein
MNKFELSLLLVNEDNPLVIEHLDFNGQMLVDVYIDDQLIRNTEFFDTALIVLSELSKSIMVSGKYLLFTSPSGIADAGGWHGVNVEVKTDEFVTWNLYRDDDVLNYKFNYVDYKSEIQKMADLTNNMKNEYKLGPEDVFFPEDWSR